MARAGYGSEQVNPGLLLVSKIYNYVQVTWLIPPCATCCLIWLRVSSWPLRCYRHTSRGGVAKLGRPTDTSKASVQSDACLLTPPLHTPLQKYHGGKTKVMASGLRTKAEALALAGCDFLVVVSAGTAGRHCTVRQVGRGVAALCPPLAMPSPVPPCALPLLTVPTLCHAGVLELVNATHAKWAWRRTIDVNLTGVFLTAQAAGRRMVAQGSGLILLTAVLVILPVLPDTYLGPDESLNPRVIWKFTVLLMVISAIGHLAQHQAARTAP